MRWLDRLVLVTEQQQQSGFCKINIQKEITIAYQQHKNCNFQKKLSVQLWGNINYKYCYVLD